MGGGGEPLGFGNGLPPPQLLAKGPRGWGGGVREGQLGGRVQEGRFGGGGAGG